MFPELQETVPDKSGEAVGLSALVLSGKPVEIEIETPQQAKQRERR